MAVFDDLTVAVTGGAGALGTAVVDRLLQAGASVYVPCFSEDERARFALAGHERVHTAAPVDLTDEKSTESFFGQVPALWASIHVAGGFTMSPLAETSVDTFHRMMNMNATTAFLSCREAIKCIRATGHRGRIVNTAARPVLVPTGGSVAYAASKAAVASMTQCIAEEVRGESIWVNAVVPSILDTPANREAMPTADHSKWPSVEDVAETIVFLASPENRTTSGSLVTVYGQS